MATTKSTPHSVRIRNDNWKRADARAKREGTNMNAMINAIVEGYGKGYINLPTVATSYSNVVVPSPASPPAAE